MAVQVRQATIDDEAAVVEFTQDTWPDRTGDYIPRVFADWVAADGDRQRTFVAVLDGTVQGLLQCVMLSDHEAWMQGMRVAPTARNQGLSKRLHDTAADWARDHGATVARNMVFSWNGPALAASRSAGFNPTTEFRWAYLSPANRADPKLSVGMDPAAAWTYWQDSSARDHLRGLGLSPDESWALSDLTPDTLEWAAETTFLAVVQEAGTRAFTLRVRDYDRTSEDGQPRQWAEYGPAAWTDASACDALFDTIRRDAASSGADRVRVLIPETVTAVSDAALAGAELADEPDFVFAADLTAEE